MARPECLAIGKEMPYDTLFLRRCRRRFVYILFRRTGLARLFFLEIERDNRNIFDIRSFLSFYVAFTQVKGPLILFTSTQSLQIISNQRLRGGQYGRRTGRLYRVTHNFFLLLVLPWKGSRLFGGRASLFAATAPAALLPAAAIRATLMTVFGRSFFSGSLLRKRFFGFRRRSRLGISRKRFTALRFSGRLLFWPGGKADGAL
jgi:hypothetical protein